jgi:gamma-glutamyltranspeptidase / glutathione hydrolase
MMAPRGIVVLVAAAAGVLAACGGGTSDVVPGTCLAVSPDGQVYDPGTPGEHGAPDIATGFVTRRAVDARSFLVVANHPVAAKAGCDVLIRGGSAVDAAIAVQMVLGLVQPQSSGLGGGGFLVRYDAATGTVHTYDGRETAPAAADENYLRWISSAQQTPPLPDARASGRSIGVPGVVAMLEAAHRDAGVLPWRDLFFRAIELANQGVRISPQLALAIRNNAAALGRDFETRFYFLDHDGAPLPEGTIQENQGLGRTLQAIADGGAAAFYTGAIAQHTVDEVADTSGGITPGALTLDDLANYHAVARDPVCAAYRDYQVCGMPPPSSGGIAIAQILGILAQFDLAALPPTGLDDNGGHPAVAAVHLVSEAERLAYADRDQYVADTDFVALPGGSPAALIDPAYLRQRAGLIRTTQSLGTASPGEFGMALGTPPAAPEHGTTQITIVDAAGNAVAMTSSVESEFGSFHMTADGFLLNNQLTDFSAEPLDAQSRPIANRVAGGKRPRSSMSPTLVFRAPGGARGELAMATGSPGGAVIIQYVAKTLVAALDWKLTAQQASALVDFGAANTPVTNVGGEHPDIDPSDGGVHDPLVTGLQSLGHTVNVAPATSGIATIIVRSATAGRYYEGGADPRREGVALGDTFKP